MTLTDNIRPASEVLSAEAGEGNTNREKTRGGMQKNVVCCTDS